VRYTPPATSHAITKGIFAPFPIPNKISKKRVESKKEVMDINSSFIAAPMM
jgi:hypothetical protein